MSQGPEFFQTMMGRKFYEADVPRIAKALERIAAALESLEVQNQIPPRNDGAQASALTAEKE